MRRDDRGDRRDDRGRRDEFRRDDMGRGGGDRDEPAPQRKRLQLQPRTKPTDAPQRRTEPVGGGEIWECNMFVSLLLLTRRF